MCLQRQVGLQLNFDEDEEEEEAGQGEDIEHGEDVKPPLFPRLPGLDLSPYDQPVDPEDEAQQEQDYEQHRAKLDDELQVQTEFGAFVLSGNH